MNVRIRSGSTRISWMIFAPAVAVAMIAVLVLGISPVSASTAPIIRTDKTDYSPGDKVTIASAGWQPEEAITLRIQPDYGLGFTTYLAANNKGQFYYRYTLPTYFVATYTVTATGKSGTATTSFTDSSVGTYDQCSNDLGGGYSTGDTGCRWINGNLNVNNSTYFEGDATVQRLWLDGLVPGSTHTVTFQYGTTKGGRHAYDFLTTWNWSEDWITVADRCQDIDGCEAAPEFTKDIPDDPNVTNTIEPTAAGSRQFVMRGGTLDSATVPAIESGSYSGDSETVITVTFTVGPSTSPMCTTTQKVTTCGVALWFGAHVALSSAWEAYDTTTGASTISGSPYHVALEAVDGAAVGSRDNQMATNAIPVGSLVIAKALTGGTYTGTFTIHYDCEGLVVGNVIISAGTFATVTNIPSGTGCTVSEPNLPTDPPAGYSFGTPTFTPSGGVVTIPTGKNASVTVTTNNTLIRDTGHLTIVKEVVNDNGGTAVVSDFGLNSDAGSLTFGAGSTVGATTTYTSQTLTVNTGTYTLKENSVAGYTPGSWSCTGAAGTVVSTYNNGSVVVGKDENVTCTIANNDIAPQLHLRKIVTNDNGGTATIADFTLTADGIGSNDLSGASPVDSGSGLIADTWALSESGPAGYAASAWSCVGGTQNGSNITVGVGGSATCTITNDDIAPKLHLRKVVTNNNGGTATTADFPLTADGTGSNDLSGTSPVDSGAGLQADTWALSETGPGGYSASAWVCVGGTQSGANITVGVGGEATCTITNDDQTAHLKLVKTVTNDNGGTAVATDFTLSATGPTPLSGAGGAESDVNAGTYDLSETNVTGYTAGSWSCVGGTQSGSSVTLALGQSATCTINNNDQTAHLELVKTVTNDNGGTAVATDFTLSATGPTPLSGAGGAESDVNAGSYTLSETTLPGYTAGSWGCTGGTFTAPDQIALALGQSATCTINNNDQQANVIVNKVVTNNNGGTAAPDDFKLTLDGNATTSGTTIPVNPGTHTAAETLLSGYSFVGFSGDCNASGQVTVALGETKTCTLTNDDIAPKLHLRKTVINDNGGSATVADFTLTADGTGSNGLSGTSPVDSGAGLQADTWALSETGPGGYSASAWVCVGGTQSGANITVGIGGEATCTITNDDQQAYVIVNKVVNNTHGGTAAPDDFKLALDGNATTSGTKVAVNPGTHTAAETLLSGYAFDGFSGDCNASGQVTVALGETKTCTLTNSDQQAYVIVNKVVTNNNGGTALPDDFKLTLDGNATTSGTKVAVNLGTHTAAETLLAGYSFTGFSGDCNTSGQVTVALGETKTCTLTNDDNAPKLHLRKIVTNDNGGTKTTADFTLTANGTGSNDLSGTSPVDSGSGLKADTWALSETNVYGYSASAWVCVGGTQSGSSITLGLGEEATCTITNDDQPGTIIVKKVTKPANTGSFPFTTSGTGYNGFTIPGGGQNSQTLNAGTYTVTETPQGGWVLTGIGGSTDPGTPYNCTVTGSGGSTGVGDLNSLTATINLKNGDTVTCVFENTGQSTTRTQGFWATHSQLANIAWFGGTAFGHTFPGVANTPGIGDTLLCGQPIDTLGKLMGGFWSNIAKTSSGDKRSELDQKRMQLLQQLLAAELNASAFGSAPSSGSFAGWEAALCSGTLGDIKTALQQAASFNTQGDSGVFTPGVSADSKNARKIADIPYWDIWQ